MSTHRPHTEPASDAELIVATRGGDSAAFAVLYERHVDGARAAARALCKGRSEADDVVSEAFAKVLKIMQGGGGPDLAFRPYLLTAVRNAFYDRVRRNREQPTESVEDTPAFTPAFDDDDRDLTAQAFATLPERWQFVLWHTEVEGRSPSDIAPLIGLAPNAVAALAYRAREGLRQAFLQAHVREKVSSDDCAACSNELGSYVRDGLSTRDRRKVDAHLEHCESCRAVVAELASANTALRAALIPAILGVPAAAYLAGLGGAGNGLWASFLRLPRSGQVAAGSGAAAGVAAAAVAVAAAVGGGPEAIATTTILPVTVPSPVTTVVVAETSPPTVVTVEIVPPTEPPEPPTTTAPSPPSTVAPVRPVVTSPPRPAPTVPPPPPSTTPPATTPPTTTPPATTAVPTTAVPTTVPGTTTSTTSTSTTTTTPPPSPQISFFITEFTQPDPNQRLMRVIMVNTGPSSESGLVVQLSLSANASFTTFFTDPMNCTEGGRCTPDTIASFESFTTFVVVTLSGPGPVTLTASLV